MANNSKQIKSRIKSVKNTKKITKSMQLISAVKMQKLVKNILKSKEYTKLSNQIIEQLSKTSKLEHPLLEEREVKKEIILIITSSRGLCGSYNSNVISKVREYIQDKDKSKIEVVAIGKKGALFAARAGIKVKSLYEKISDKPEYDFIIPIANEIIQDFINEKADRVTIFTTNFISSFIQEVEFKTLLPLKIITSEQVEENDLREFKFEPDQDEILNYMLPKIFEIQFFQALLESAASEHSARMMAMKNATDSATELSDTLTFELNKTRQAAITQEVAEIVSGMKAQKR